MTALSYDINFDQSPALTALSIFSKPQTAIEWVIPRPARTATLTISPMIETAKISHGRNATLVEQQILASALRSSTEFLYEF